MPGPTWAKLETWKALAAKGEAPADTALLKSYVADVKADSDARTVEFTISTGAVDRDRDTIAVDGWKLAAYRKNPVVQWSHDYSIPPIARATKLRVDGDSLKATAEFAPAEVYPFAETIFQLIKGGFLKATSVGFRPLKHAFNAERGGMDFMSQELLEFSVVPVPANADCLMEGKAAGIDIGPLKAWVEATCRAMGYPITFGEHGVVRVGDNLHIADTKVVVHKPETMPPDGEGHCPAGYEMGSDGMCHEKATAAISHPAAPAVTREDLAALEAKLLAQIGSGPGRSAPETDDVVLALEDEPDEDEGIVLDAEDLQTALTGAVAAIVNTEVRSAVNALRGRVD